MNWIDINEYASKYSVTIHSLRNKILLNEIEFVCNSGKYKIKDEPLEKDFSFKENIQDTKPFNYEKIISTLEKNLEEKTKEYQRLNTQYVDLKNLFDWIEQENKQMKKVIKGLERIDDFLKKK